MSWLGGRDRKAGWELKKRCGQEELGQASRAEQDLVYGLYEMGFRELFLASPRTGMNGWTRISRGGHRTSLLTSSQEF